MNGVDLAAARRRLSTLRAAHAQGDIDDAAFAARRAAIEREIGEHLLDDAERPRPSRRFVGLLAASVLGLAVFGYWRTGSPLLALGDGATATVAVAASGAAPAASGGGDPAVGLAQIAAMVESLATRMKERPDDAEGWTMLARSYTVLGRFNDAVPAYRRAATLRPGDAALLADWADTTAAMRGKVDNADSAELIARALAIDARQPKALALAGTAAYERGDYAGAIARWRLIVAQLPPGSEMAAQIEASIAEASSRRGAAASAAAGPPTAAAATATPAVDADASSAGVTGTVQLDPAVAAQTSPSDAVFVFARDAAGGRMPLAVQRATVADLPLAFRLDDAMAMAPGAPKLSAASALIVGARVSRSGNAVAAPGDLSGQAATPVAPGASGVAIRIDAVVGR